MPAAASSLHALLDAGHPGAEVVELAQPAFDRAEAEGDERAEAELYRVVGRAWRAAQHPDDVDELAAIRELARTEPGSIVARLADAALARRLADDPPPEHRLDAFRQLASAGRLLERIEGWGGTPPKRGTPGILARL
jgi:hypothetical protein